MEAAMNKVIVAWCKTNSYDFENHVPLAFVGAHNKRLGFSNGIHVLFIEGFSKLDALYKQQLIDFGYILHDAAALYQSIADRYKQLDRFGDYEKKCFLRWPVLETFFAGEPVIHFDGDIVFNEDPAVIAELVAGKTFVLQGCPAFTVISNNAWFAQYRQALDLFVLDIDGYSAHAWQQRDGWDITFTTRWAGSRFREIITSDQDFISHLIHTGQLVQEPVESVMRCLSGYIYFENPLFPHMYDNNFPYRYVRENGIDYFEGIREDGSLVPFKKRVLFWHMQSCFNFYLSKLILRKKFLGSITLGRLPFHLSSQGLEESFNKFMRRFLHHTTRLNVYRYFFEKRDFSGIFKGNIWWKKGIFE